MTLPLCGDPGDTSVPITYDVSHAFPTTDTIGTRLGATSTAATGGIGGIGGVWSPRAIVLVVLFHVGSTLGPAAASTIAKRSCEDPLGKPFERGLLVDLPSRAATRVGSPDVFSPLLLLHFPFWMTSMHLTSHNVIMSHVY